MPNINLKDWLSGSVLERVSFATSKKENDRDCQMIMLTDGTLITIDRGSKLVCGNAFVGDLENPHDIRIKDRCKVDITHSGNKKVSFIVTSALDLEEKWNKFKRTNSIDQSTVGTIAAINFTNDQKDQIDNLMIAGNRLLNLLLDTDISLSSSDLQDMKLSERYYLINYVLTSVSRILVGIMAPKIHLPFGRKEEGTGALYEIHEYIDEKTFTEE